MSSRRTLLVLATALATPLAGCSPEVVDSDADAIDQYIWSLPYLPSDPEQVQMGDRGAATQDGDYLCTTQNLAETRQYDKIVAYAANSESMWPGAILSGESVLTGLFTQNVFRREPMTISVGLESLEGKKSAVVRSPSLAGYRDALTSILDATVTGATPANIYSEIEEVHSELDGDVTVVGVDVTDTEAAGKEMVASTGVTYRNARDPRSEIFAVFGGIALPRTVLIDGDGTIVATHSGELDADELRALLDENGLLPA